MKQSYYIFSSGALHRKDNSITLEKEDGTMGDIPVERIYDIYVFAEMQYNTSLFTFLSQHGILLHMFNYYEYYTGTFYPKEAKISGDLLIKQVEHYSDYEKRLKIAREFVASGADNIYRNLRYYNGRGKDLAECMDYVKRIERTLEKASTIEEIMGCEGSMRREYYRAWNIIINADINFEKRVKRPPDNMINTMISFCNSLLYTKILSEIYKTQINPTISYLHQPGTKRFSLALDISEVFKPLIVDRLIFALFNKNIITEDDFDDEIGYLRIKEKGIKRIVEEFEKRLKETIKHKTLNRDVSYKHLIRLEIYKLIKHIYGEEDYTGFRIWW